MIFTLLSGVFCIDRVLLKNIGIEPFTWIFRSMYSKVLVVAHLAVSGYSNNPDGEIDCDLGQRRLIHEKKDFLLVHRHHSVSRNGKSFYPSTDRRVALPSPWWRIGKVRPPSLI